MSRRSRKRSKVFRKQRPQAGSHPGVLTPPADAPPPRIRVMQYDRENVRESDVSKPEELRSCLGGPGVCWIDVQGIGDADAIQRIGDVFGIHPLALEDSVNVPSRCKTETYPNLELVVTRMARVGEDGEPTTEQATLLIGRGWLLTIQERWGDPFDPVRERIRRPGMKVREMGADFLAYALIDAVIDGYYPVLDLLGERLERIEGEVLEGAGGDVVRRLYAIRHELLALRRGALPMREVVAGLMRGENPFVSDAVRVYLRDCYDHVVQIAEALETYRELTTGLVELHLAAVSNRMNQVMQVLTVMASIFIPLTFIAGVYGMNFEHMPELHHRWGYPLALAAMTAVALGMLVFFARRGWLGRGAGRGPRPFD